MKNTKKKKSENLIFGFKVSSKTLSFIVIAGICSMILIIDKTYRNYKLTRNETEIVTAKILDVGTRWRGGTRLNKMGYIKFAYFINKKEITHTIYSFKIRDEIDKYYIGDCIELLVSLKNENVYEWNEEKGTFKCL